MHTTACEPCRKVRIRCVRPSRGRDEAETCDRCQANGLTCTTIKRRLGRQAGVKNRPKAQSVSPEEGVEKRYYGLHHHSEHLPNPLQVLAAEAARDTNLAFDDLAQAEGGSSHELGSQITYTADKQQILNMYGQWCSKIHQDLGQSQVSIGQRISDILMPQQNIVLEIGRAELPVFCGRNDMSRPDASPENDVISLQVISLLDAERLYRSFIDLITNGSMYFDPQLHTLSYIRSRSSYLLATILAIASTYTTLNASRQLHDNLFLHVTRLENEVSRNNYRSIEIVQAYLLLASWSDIPTVLSRDTTWMYISRAIGLAVELRLDSPLPYCIQADPMYSPSTHDVLVRNAHRVCYLLFIHDRNMAMVAGRYPVFPEAAIFSITVLNKWGQSKAAQRFDEPICASVSLRKIVRETLNVLAVTSGTFHDGLDLINSTIATWRSRWTTPIQSTHEYDIIARFSAFVLALTMLKKSDHTQCKDDTSQARVICEDMAFEVCCASIQHYKTWSGLLNSATFDTCMVAFCAIYIIQSINRINSPLSDWDIFRIATLQELVSDLESQARARHAPISESGMSVVEAMAKQLGSGIRMVLNRRSLPVVGGSNNIPEFHHHFGEMAMEPFMFNTNNAMPFIPEWDVRSLLPDLGLPWSIGIPDSQDLLFQMNQ